MENLLLSIKTTEDRDKLISEIDLISHALFKEGELKNVLDGQVSTILRSYIGEDISSEKISDKISEAAKAMDTLTVAKLTLAFSPSESVIDKISSFVRKNFGEKTILELHFEPHILAGAIIEFEGLYRDYTLRTKLEEVFKNKREELSVKI